MSAAAPPHPGGLPVGHEFWQDEVAEPPPVAGVTQHTWPGQSIAAAHSMEAAPVGQPAAVAAQLPCKAPPICVRQQIGSAIGQLGHRPIRVGEPPSMPPLLPLLLPLLAPPLLPLLPLPLLAPLLPPLLPLLLLLPPASPLFGLLLLEPPHAAARATPTDAANRTLIDFIQATSAAQMSGC